MSPPRRSSPSFVRRYLRGEAFLQFWNTLAKGLGVTNSFLVLSALSVYQFGLYQLVVAVVIITESFTTGLFDDIITNDVARGVAEGERGMAKRLFAEFALLKVVSGVMLGVLLYFGADLVSDYYGNDIGLYVRLSSVLVAIGALRAALESYFTATVSLAGMSLPAIQEVAKGLLLVAFLSNGSLGIREALLATIGAAVVAVVVSSSLFLKSYRRIFSGVRLQATPVLGAIFAHYGWWVYLRYASAKALKGIRPWLIRIFLNTEAVGLYTLAVNLITLAQSVFPIGMLGRLLPWEAAHPERMRFIFSRAVKYALWGGVAFAAGGFLVVPPLIGLFLPAYVPAMDIFRVLLLTLPLYGVYKLHKSILTVLREQKILAARVVSESLWVVVLDVLLLPTLGLIGVALEYVFTYLARVVLFTSGLRRTHPELTLRPKAFFRFDVTDWMLLAKLGREALTIVVRRPARARSQP